MSSSMQPLYILLCSSMFDSSDTWLFLIVMTGCDTRHGLVTSINMLIERNVHVHHNRKPPRYVDSVKTHIWSYIWSYMNTFTLTILVNSLTRKDLFALCLLTSDELVLCWLFWMLVTNLENARFWFSLGYEHTIWRKQTIKADFFESIKLSILVVNWQNLTIVVISN